MPELSNIAQDLGFATVPVEQLAPLQLAYIGDTVFDLYVRSFLIETHNIGVHGLHLLSNRMVCAAGQAAAYFVIEPLLTESERNIFRRGRNAHSGTVPKNASVGDYRLATGLETLIGYLFCTGNSQRIGELMQRIIKENTKEHGIQSR